MGVKLESVLKPDTLENVVEQIELMRDCIPAPERLESEWLTGARDTLDALADWIEPIG